ncbi:MAG: tetratricopeptide repeat protein [Anaerolineaceae bacterium]|nr:tetratricopeptide repeat protein [Anaerolineaceae bacterium]
MNTRLQINCLGDFTAILDGQQITSFETDKTRALLIYLVVESGFSFKRSHLAGLLWPDEKEERALQNLRQTLSYLRKGLGESNQSANLILSDRESIQINPKADIQVDYLAFKKFLQKGLFHYQSQIGNGLFHVRFLQYAIDQFQGEFLSHFSVNKSFMFEEWVMLYREEVNLQMVRALNILCEYHEKRTEYQLAIEKALRIVEICPWDEPVRNRIMRLLGINRQWTAAKSQFLAMQRYLKEQLLVEPSQESTKLYNQICLAAEGKVELISDIASAHYHLPQNDTAFIGRQDELDRVMEMLISPEMRLVTLLGLGGIGKTRLASEIAKQMIGIFPDGVFFVSLIPEKSDEQIVQLIGESMGLVFPDQSWNQRQLFIHMHDKELLLVLDNFEHLLGKSTITEFLDGLLRATRKVKVLATSREILNLSQEHVYALTGLPFPKEENISVEQFSDFDSLKLFGKRIAQKQPLFKITEHSMHSMVRICRLLEGLPLGVELAAAVVFEQGQEHILKAYEDDLSALATRMVNFQQRHRSLDAAFEISWELLSDGQQTMLYALTFFSDGFEFEAARQISNANAEYLAALAAKSLLRRDQNGRYIIHEAIRQFVGKKTLEGINAEEIREAHAIYYAGFLSKSQPDLLNEHQMEALHRIQREFGNITLAWQWIVEHKDAHLMKICLDSLYHYFSIRSMIREGVSWFGFGLERLCKPKTTEDKLVCGMLLWRSGVLYYAAYDDEKMMDCLLSSQEILITENALEELAYCRHQLSRSYLRNDELDLAQHYADLVLEHFTAQKNIQGLTMAYSQIGLIIKCLGDFMESQQYFKKALKYCRQSKDQRNLIYILNLMADNLCYEGTYDEAAHLFQESLEISLLLEDRYSQAKLLNNLGTIYQVQQDFETAKQYYENSLDIVREIGDAVGIVYAINNLGELATSQGQFDVAIRYSEEALEIAQKLDDTWTLIICHNNLGEAYCALNDFEESTHNFSQAMKLSIDSIAYSSIGRVIINWARVYQMSGSTEKAKSYLLAGVSHSATEKELQEKAIIWLAEMDVHWDGVMNDDLLTGLIERGELKPFS